MDQTISVGLGEQVVSKEAGVILVAFGLGSCLGIGMYDAAAHVSGLLHAVLPAQTNGADRSPKYVDTGIESLLQAMLKAGADQRRIVTRVAGGANMLLSSSLNNTFDIGTRNIEAARRTFARMNIKVYAEQVGGNTGRTVRLYVVDGRMTVRVVGGKEQDL